MTHSFPTLRSSDLLLRPLGAVTTSLNAVLTGRQPTANVAETQDEFGDIVRAMRRIQAQAEHIRRIAYLDPGSQLPNRNSLEAEQIGRATCRERVCQYV